MSNLKQLNVRIPPITQAQLSELLTKTGMTVTQIVVVAIDRMARREGVDDKKNNTVRA